MNCLEFRQQLLAEPHCDHSQFLEHLANCDACAHEYQRVQAMERDLAQAINVTPPAGMASRIIATHRLNGERRHKQSLNRVLPLAAGVFLIALGSLLMLANRNEPLPLQELVLHHVHDEVDHLYAGDSVDIDRLVLTLETVGISSTESFGSVTFAANCLMRQFTGAHIVMGGKTGPVSVLFMPGESAPDRLAFSDERFHGLLRTTRYGSFAVIGERGEPLEAVAEKIYLSTQPAAGKRSISGNS